MTEDQLAGALYYQLNYLEGTIDGAVRTLETTWERESDETKSRFRRQAQFVERELAERTREAILFGVNSVFADLAIITKDGITVQRATTRARGRWERRNDQAKEHAGEKATEPAATATPGVGDAPVPAQP